MILLSETCMHICPCPLRLGTPTAPVSYAYRGLLSTQKSKPQDCNAASCYILACSPVYVRRPWPGHVTRTRTPPLLSPPLGPPSPPPHREQASKARGLILHHPTVLPDGQGRCVAASAALAATLRVPARAPGFAAAAACGAGDSEPPLTSTLKLPHYGQAARAPARGHLLLGRVLTTRPATATATIGAGSNAVAGGDAVQA